MLVAHTGVLMTEIGDDIAVEVVAWRWSMLSWLDFWNVIELFMVILSMGIALGYLCAVRVERARVVHVPAPVPEPPPVRPLRCEFCTDKVNLNLFPYNRCSGCGASPSYHHGRCCPTKREVKKIPMRTIGTQSQCTYKRNLLTPRFYPLPEQAEGVFDISF